VVRAADICGPDKPTGTPVIEVFRTAYEENGSAVEVNEMAADASTYVFRYDFQLPSST
jgi:GntR family transcriptional regulator